MKSINDYTLTACVVLVIATLGACEAGSAGAAQDVAVAPAEDAGAGTIEGSVLEISQVAGYTYVKVDADGDVVWAAAPTVPVQVGDTVSFTTNMPMRDFYSKTLQRNFEIIYFVDQFKSDTGISSFDSEAAAAHGQMFSQEAIAPVKNIRKAEGGYTVAEIFAQSNELNGKPVTVRGRVAKVTPNVMGTHWIRIMDGSSRQHLVVPTDATTAVNDVVVADGTLVTNMDLGQGYVLPAVLQDASVTIE